MRALLTLPVLLPLVVAWPSHIPCASDATTRIAEGSPIMGVKLTMASDVTMTAKRADTSVNKFIQGEWLVVQISGFAGQSGALVRASDAANATFDVEKSDLTLRTCAGQVATHDNVKLPTASASITFRPGCTDPADKMGPIKLQFVSATNYGSPIHLTELTLSPETDSTGKVMQDKSCNGGPIPPAPSPVPVLQSSKYTTLVWMHRIGVILTWGFLFPLGVSLVRNNYSGSRLNLHRYVQSFGLVVEAIQLTCIIMAHHEGPTGQGPAPGDLDFGITGMQGSAPSLTHKQRGLAVDICVVLQLILGVLRPKPYPNNFLRRVWIWAHRFIGDSVLVVAWVNLWEAIAQDQKTPTVPVAIVTVLLQVTAVIGVPFYLMLQASKVEDESRAGSVIASTPQAVDEEAPIPQFFGCGDCNQVYTEQRALKVHYRFTHPETQYKEIRTPMPQRFANVMNIPGVSAGVPLSEVMKHNQREDCWCVINGNVYDLTNFVSAHPGGPNPILSWAGRDASKAWNLIHQAAWISQYRAVEMVGPLAPEPPVPGMGHMDCDSPLAESGEVPALHKRTGFSLNASTAASSDALLT